LIEEGGRRRVCEVCLLASKRFPSRSLEGAGKRQNLGRNYREVVAPTRQPRIMINGSFVFGWTETTTTSSPAP